MILSELFLWPSISSSIKVRHKNTSITELFYLLNEIIYIKGSAQYQTWWSFLFFKYEIWNCQSVTERIWETDKLSKGRRRRENQQSKKKAGEELSRLLVARYQCNIHSQTHSPLPTCSVWGGKAKRHLPSLLSPARGGHVTKGCEQRSTEGFREHFCFLHKRKRCGWHLPSFFLSSCLEQPAIAAICAMRKGKENQTDLNSMLLSRGSNASSL